MKNITAIALAGLTDSTVLPSGEPRFSGIPGHCQEFARDVSEAVGGSVGAAMDKYRTGSALGTMVNFEPTSYNVWENIGSSDDKPAPGFLQPGDFLYKGRATSGAFGHVGIYIGTFKLMGQPPLPCVAENSSYHIDPDHMGNVSGAKGIRTLTAFGPFEMVVRLTEPD